MATPACVRKLSSSSWSSGPSMNGSRAPRGPPPAQAPDAVRAKPVVAADHGLRGEDVGNVEREPPRRRPTRGLLAVAERAREEVRAHIRIGDGGGAQRLRSGY